MRIALVYPVPVDNLGLFQTDIDKFFETLGKFDPGHEYDLILVNSHYRREFGQRLHNAIEPWADMVHDAIVYTGEGCDIGSHQHAAHCIDYDLMVCCSTRVYFHREGWLSRLMEAVSEFGTGMLYGAMGCYERAPHIRTCFYAISPANFRRYPHLIQNREQTFMFETGAWNFTKWAGAEGITPLMVTWEGIYTTDGWRTPKNIYRRGDQSNILAWDRHTKIYAEATPERQRELQAYAGDKL